MLPVLFGFLTFLAGTWIFVLSGGLGMIGQSDLLVTRQNLFLPTALLVAIFLILTLGGWIKKKESLVILALLVITLFDLFRFGWKFLPFSNREYLFPQTKVINYLQNQKGPFRVSATDSQISLQTSILFTDSRLRTVTTLYI
jgi:hypothetical protein